MGVLSSNFCLLRIAKDMNFTEKRVLYSVKYVGVKKIKLFTNELSCLKKAEIVFKVKTGLRDSKDELTSKGGFS